MSDITLNTRRFTNASGFAGASRNDLLRIAAQALDYADEISSCDSQEPTRQVPVAYCVYGKFYRDVIEDKDHESTMASVIRRLREENEDIDADDTEFRFDYDGMTFVVMTEEQFNARVECEIESHIEMAEYDFQHQLKDNSYVCNYVKFDRDMFARDLMMDVGSLVGHYDGQYHEMYVNEHSSGDGDIVTRRETLYMIRED
jgi:hypothetical protein